jgi:hypothetical protein
VPLQPDRVSQWRHQSRPHPNPSARPTSPARSWGASRVTLTPSRVTLTPSPRPARHHTTQPHAGSGTGYERESLGAPATSALSLRVRRGLSLVGGPGSLKPGAGRERGGGELSLA